MNQKKLSKYFNPPKILILIFLTVTFLFNIGGCGHSQSSGSYSVKPAFKGIESTAKVAIIINDFSTKYSPISEKKLYENIQAALKDLNLNIKLIPPDEFRKLALPNSTSDKSTTISWHELIKDSAFRDRIEPLALKYLILIEPDSQSSFDFEAKPYSKSDVIGFGFGWSQIRSTGLVAKVIDLSEPREIAEILSNAVKEGGYGLGAGVGISMVFPIVFPIISPAGDDFGLAGKELAENIAALFSIPSFKKIKSVKSAVKQENGNIEICAEFEDLNELGSSESYIVTLPLSSLKDGTTDPEVLGFKRYQRCIYGMVSIVYYLYPIENAKKGCDKISSRSLTSGSVLSIGKLIVDLEKICQISALLNSVNEGHPNIERVYEVHFASKEEGIIVEKENNVTKDELAKGPQEVRLIYWPPQITQEATNTPIFTIGLAGGYKFLRHFPISVSGG
jgi:hypothetical protein